MNALALSLVRTYVPIIVGALVSWLITLGVELDSGTQAGLIAGLTGLLSAVYYTAARLLERKFPGLSILLGTTAQPVAYSKADPAA